MGKTQLDLLQSNVIATPFSATICTSNARKLLNEFSQNLKWACMFTVLGSIGHLEHIIKRNPLKGNF